jgi:hypothetical protein
MYFVGILNPKRIVIQTKRTNASFEPTSFIIRRPVWPVYVSLRNQEKWLQRTRHAIALFHSYVGLHR